MLFVSSAANSSVRGCRYPSFHVKTKFGANLGPYFSYLLSDNVEISTGNDYGSAETLNVTNLGVIFGLYSNIKVTEKVFITLELRNNYDFLGNSYSKNETHSLLLGLEYLIK